ncbi:hypothetical protein FTUN_8556 [Frigoriglobus tundricola]|uniref:Uncharacterized protein n=1 Tax=Frigoriglobus tundricola TaxID=2774151 RepID=A0A6M5Z3C5_9BACT|nr:hypothetical protein FTUN_8556 [Frigoriglobus tundricola]
MARAGVSGGCVLGRVEYGSRGRLPRNMKNRVKPSLRHADERGAKVTAAATLL